MQDDVARDNHDADQLLARDDLNFQIGQVAYWKKRYEQARDVLEAGDAPPNTINVAMGALPMLFETCHMMTGGWCAVDKNTYERYDGAKRAIIVLESK
jgi:hypothetical protein